MTPLERFNEMREHGTEAYFDADEIVELIEHFDEEDDRRGYTQALELGLRLHPEDVEIQTMKCRLYMYDRDYDKALQMIRSLRNHADAETMILNAMELECLYATDRAAVMGLAGYEPETVPAVVCESLMEEVEAAGELVVDGAGPIPFSPSADIHFLPGRVLPYHVNGMTLTAYCASGAEILRRTYYSVGGGFVMEDVGTPGSPSGDGMYGFA